MFTPVMFASVLPEILILILAVILLCVEPFWKEDQRRNAGWLTAGGSCTRSSGIGTFSMPISSP